MKHLFSLGIKFVASLVMLFVILGLIFNLSFQSILLITVILGLVSYMLGDLLLLRRTNNTVATISDFVLAFLIVWFTLASITDNETNLFTASLLSGIGIALFEFFFHKYLSANVFNKKVNHNKQRSTSLQYQTEASKEIYPSTPKKEK